MTSQIMFRVPDLSLLFQAPHDAVQHLDGVMGLTIFQQPPYQVQLWLVRPNKEIPDHAHPNCETVLVYISGDLILRVGGKSFTFDEVSVKTNPRMCRGSTLYVAAGAVHGLSVGRLGGAFLSVQRWNGQMKSTDLDWVGDVLGSLHASRLVQ